MAGPASAMAAASRIKSVLRMYTSVVNRTSLTSRTGERRPNLAGRSSITFTCSGQAQTASER
jgi:hypothetical protein